MAIRTAAELQDSAKQFRELATLGGDVRLQALLTLVAAEFEAEANQAWKDPAVTPPTSD